MRAAEKKFGFKLSLKVTNLIMLTSLALLRYDIQCDLFSYAILLVTGSKQYLERIQKMELLRSFAVRTFSVECTSAAIQNHLQSEF